jgi:hypothetical protein
MTITFYNQLNDNRVVSKTLPEPLHSAECTPCGECEIQNPVITVRPFKGYGQVNYCYIDDYNRYYYITSVTVKSGGLLELRCKVDVLMSFGNAIRDCRGVCVANENVGSSYVPDKNLPIDLRKKTKAYMFSDSDFNVGTATDTSNNFVLNVTGGNAAEPEQ